MVYNKNFIIFCYVWFIKFDICKILRYEWYVRKYYGFYLIFIVYFYEICRNKGVGRGVWYCIKMCVWVFLKLSNDFILNIYVYRGLMLRRKS